MSPEIAGAPADGSRDPSLASRYLGAQLAGNRREAVRIVVDEGLGAGWSVEALMFDVIQAAQREIGRLWQENRITIADEHVATAISQLALARLYQQAERGPSRGKRVTLACVEGELHDMGARLATDFLEMRGFDVCFLGANVPVESLAARVAADTPDLVALSVTMTFHLPALRRSVAALRAVAGGDLPIVAGGHAFAWTRDAVVADGLTASSGDAREMAEDVCRILGC